MSRYEELIGALKKVVAPDDVIGAMICEIKNKELPTDPKYIHGAIMQLKTQYPDLLKDFVFFEGNSFPFSDLLERVLFRLESSLILSTLNPSYEKYNTVNCNPQIVETFRSKFSEEDYQRIKEMAKQFEALVNEQLH
ncbi:MAG: hypothetical protein K6U80_08345 [Firmicutes bacterium]|nr:hypothetical protein [Bacillota bacterium]